MVCVSLQLHVALDDKGGWGSQAAASGSVREVALVKHDDPNHARACGDKHKGRTEHMLPMQVLTRWRTSPLVL